MTPRKVTIGDARWVTADSTATSHVNRRSPIDLSKDIIKRPRRIRCRRYPLLAQNPEILKVFQCLLNLQKLLVRKDNKFLPSIFLDDLRVNAHDLTAKDAAPSRVPQSTTASGTEPPLRESIRSAILHIALDVHAQTPAMPSCTNSATRRSLRREPWCTLKSRPQQNGPPSAGSRCLPHESNAERTPTRQTHERPADRTCSGCATSRPPSTRFKPSPAATLHAPELVHFRRPLTSFTWPKGTTFTSLGHRPRKTPTT